MRAGPRGSRPRISTPPAPQGSITATIPKNFSQRLSLTCINTPHTLTPGHHRLVLRPAAIGLRMPASGARHRLLTPLPAPTRSPRHQPTDPLSRHRSTVPRLALRHGLTELSPHQRPSTNPPPLRRQWAIPPRPWRRSTDPPPPSRLVGSPAERNYPHKRAPHHNPVHWTPKLEYRCHHVIPEVRQLREGDARAASSTCALRVTQPTRLGMPSGSRKRLELPSRSRGTSTRRPRSAPSRRMGRCGSCRYCDRSGRAWRS
jgi:hypothetical protein